MHHSGAATCSLLRPWVGGMSRKALKQQQQQQQQSADPVWRLDGVFNHLSQFCQISPYWESLLSPFPSPPAPKLALLICLNLPGATFDLPRVEKRGLLFQAVFSSLFHIDFGRVPKPNLPSKMVKNHAKTLPELKTSVFENMVFYLHGSMKFKGSGLPKSPKIIRKQVARTM